MIKEKQSNMIFLVDINQMYSQRNKNRQRFRTQTFKESFIPTSPKETKPYMTFHSPSAQQQLSNSRCSSEPNILIISNLEKHIEYIEKKLMDTENQLQTLSNNNQWLKSQILEKEGVIIKATNRLQEEEMKNRELLIRYENLQTDFSNYQLQLKVEMLNKELNQQKQYEKKSEALNKSYRKDKFSSAFLPSPFGSPKHFQEKSPETFHNITRESLPELNSTIKNPFESSLWSEWRKLKNEKAKKDKEIMGLTKKVEELKQELTQEKKQSSKVKTDLLRSQQKYSSETSKLKGRIVTYIKDQKMLMNKLKSSEQKMIELSLTMKGDAEGERFFAHSSALQLQQIFQKISHNLQFDSATIDITINNPQKQEEGSQTEEKNNQYLDTIGQLQKKLKEKDGELSQQQKEWTTRFEENSSCHMNELKEASDLIDAYKSRLQHLKKQFEERDEKECSKVQLIREVSVQQQGKSIEKVDVLDEEVDCNLISTEEWMRQQEIVHRVQQLLDLNEVLKNRVQSLQMLNSNLEKANMAIEEKYHHEKHILLQKVSQGHAELELEGQICQNCSKSKQKLLQKEMRIMESGHLIEDLHYEKDHFFNAYQDKLNQYTSLEKETQEEMEKLKNQLSEKNEALAHLLYEHELKNQDYSRQREEVKQLKLTVLKLERQIQLYEEQQHRQ